jgi:hypothetical protein
MSAEGPFDQLHQSRSIRSGVFRTGLVCVFVFIAAAAFTSGSAPQAAVQAPAFLLEPGKAGPFELGATVEEIYRLVGRDRVRLVDLFNEGMFTPALEIQSPESNAGPAIIAHIREWPCAQFSVSGILVRDYRFRTREDLGIGSTLGELRRHYTVEIMRGEGDEIAYVRSLNLSLVLAAEETPTDSSKVKSVWVPPQPQEVRKRRCPHLGPLR